MNFYKMMDIDPPTNFPTKDDEIKYWMDTAHEMYHRSDATMHELHEYQENSQYLERELESSFWESDKKNRHLTHENFKLIAHNEELKAKLNEQIAAYAVLQNEVQSLKMMNIELVNKIRNLEQKNDDLERDNRALKMVEEDMESRYNDAIEKIALLETDLLEENYAKFDAERLERENKDLKRRIESFREESKSDFVRTHKDGNQMRRSFVQNRSSYNAACSANSLFGEYPRRGAVPTVEEEIPEIHARSEKYHTEGRDLSQVFARYKQQQDNELNSLNLSIELRAKKVKDEEKRQRLLSFFVRRLRAARDQLLRKNE